MDYTYDAITFGTITDGDSEKTTSAEIKFELNKYQNLFQCFESNSVVLTGYDARIGTISTPFAGDRFFASTDSSSQDIIKFALCGGSFALTGKVKNKILLQQLIENHSESQTRSTTEYESAADSNTDSEIHSRFNNVIVYEPEEPFSDSYNSDIYCSRLDGNLQASFSIRPSYIKYYYSEKNLNTLDYNTDSSGHSVAYHPHFGFISSETIGEETNEYEFTCNEECNSLNVDNDNAVAVAAALVGSNLQCAVALSANSSYFDDKLNHYGFLTYNNNYFNSNDLSTLYDYKVFGNGVSCVTLTGTSENVNSWPAVEVNTEYMFFYGITKRFYMCDQNGYLLSSIAFNNDSGDSMTQYIALSSQEVSIYAPKITDIFEEMPYLSYRTYNGKLIWKKIADETLGGNYSQFAGLIETYNESCGDNHTSIQNVNNADFNNILFYDSNSNIYSSNSFSDFYNDNPYNNNVDSYDYSFATVITANSYSTLKRELTKVNVQHPKLRLAGFIKDSDASYIVENGLEGVSSIYDDRINFISFSKSTTDFLSSHEFYRPYHSILTPVFYIPSTIVIDICGNNELSSICDNKHSAISSAIRILSGFSESNVLDLENTSTCELCSFNTKKSSYHFENVQNKDQFIRAIKKATLYSNAIYNVNVDTDSDGKVNIGQSKITSDNFARIIQLATTNSTCFISGKRAAKALMLNPATRDGRPYVQLGHVDSINSTKSFFYWTDNSGISPNQRVVENSKPLSYYALNDYTELDILNGIEAPKLLEIYQYKNMKNVFMKMFYMLWHSVFINSRVRNLFVKYITKKIGISYNNEDAQEESDVVYTMTLGNPAIVEYDILHANDYKDIGLWYSQILEQYNLLQFGILQLFFSFIGTNAIDDNYASYVKSFLCNCFKLNGVVNNNYKSNYVVHLYDNVLIRENSIKPALDEVFDQFFMKNCCEMFNADIIDLYNILNDAYTSCLIADHDEDELNNDIKNHELINGISDDKLKNIILNKSEFTFESVNDLMVEIHDALLDIYKTLLDLVVNMYFNINDVYTVNNSLTNLQDSEKFDLMFNAILRNYPQCGFLTKNMNSDHNLFLID